MEKSRVLNLNEYLVELQKEYISAIIRFHIYTREKDKNFWKKIIDLKESKINSVLQKSTSASIFTDTDLRRKVCDNIIPFNGLIELSYRDSEERETLLQKEYKLYYKEGEVYFTSVDEIGRCIEINYHTKCAVIELSNELKSCRFAEIKRYFKDDRIDPILV